MRVVRTDSITFQNGKVLEIPVIDGQLDAGETFRFSQANVIAMVLLSKNGSGASLIESHLGVPFDSANGWLDMDGYRWYMTKSEGSYNNYTLHIGSMSITSMMLGPTNTNYCFAVGVYFAYKTTWDGDGVIRILGTGNTGSSIFFYLGVGQYTNINTGGSQYAFKGSNVNYARQINVYRLYGSSDFAWIEIYAKNTAWNIPSQSGGYTTNANWSNSLKKDVKPAPYDDDPNRSGGNSGRGGGGGTFDRTSDSIPVPSLPTLNATKAGFVTLYKPTLSDLINLAEYLWSNNIISILTQYFSNPMDIIIGLGIVPVEPSSSSSDFPSAGTITVPFSFSVIDSQYFSLDCGSIQVKEFWGSAFDYAPYTQIQIYLPYIGVRELNTDEIMGKTIGVKYHIDLFGGACMAYITVDGSIRYQFAGNCMQQIPVNAANYDQLVQNLVSVACVVGSGIAAAGASGVAAAATDAAAASEVSGGAVSATSGQVARSGITGEGYSEARMNGLKGWAGSHGGQLADCAVDAVMGSKPRIERTGSLAATTGQLAVQTPYLIISRAEQCLPVQYKHYRGYPSNITATLGDLSGYTEVENIRLNDLAATQGEIMEIYELLYRGVII